VNILNDILNKIGTLNCEDKEIIYKKLRDEHIKSREKMLDLKHYKGIARGLWKEDGQLFVNRLREEIFRKLTDEII